MMKGAKPQAATVLSVLYLVCVVATAPAVLEDPYAVGEDEWDRRYEGAESGRAQEVVVLGGSGPEGDSDFQGWYDPRINGGRMLDVRTSITFICGFVG